MSKIELNKNLLSAAPHATQHATLAHQVARISNVALALHAELQVRVPVGTIIRFATAAGPGDGWLACDGTVRDVEDYPELGELLKANALATTFTLPQGGLGERIFVKY